MNAEIENQVIDELVAQGYNEDEVIGAIVDLEDAEGFDGVYFADGDKKALRQAKKQARKEARAEKKAARQAKRDDKKAAKAEKKAAKSGSGLDTAERIGGLVTGLGNTATGFMDSLANLKNSGAQEKVVDDYPTPPPAEEEESSKLPLILGISAAVILVVVVIIIIKKKKK
ncbi:MAG: hypothetical protein IIT61_03260 [Bacteroidales bacterium]|nr:hypothetical protein [Bacteroidales bacterium]MBQ2350853.1 hypothetical protein [Bacteroidales bacterium]MBQ2573980.1 hypothetical protein [Bacteroidales bacterium]MBQ5423925.1 hypothetical protein [Bacteroidales bacterium]MBQ5457722.1 hypothetical protein [Bacteroidales bacterium]